MKYVQWEQELELKKELLSGAWRTVVLNAAQALVIIAHGQRCAQRFSSYLWVLYDLGTFLLGH